MKIAAECCEQTNVSIIKFEEGASKALIRNPDRRSYLKVAVDGCVIKNQIAADGALYDDQSRAIIIELKGGDVAYGARQIIAAAEVLTKSDMKPSKLAGLVVGKEYPRITSSIQKSQNLFAKNFRGPLHIVTKNGDFEFDAILSFRGPHRI